MEIEIELVAFKRFQAHYAMDLDEKMSVQARRKEEGNALFKKGQYEAAIKKYEEALEYGAWDSEVQKREDRSLQRKEKERKAVDEIKVASHVNMAVCYLRIADKCYAHEKLGNRERAIEQCNKARQMAQFVG